MCCYYNTVPLLLYYVRCLLQPEGAEAVATGLASYSLLELVLRLLRVGVWARSVLPLTLREAQGILFDLQVTPTLEAHRHTTAWRDARFDTPKFVFTFIAVFVKPTSKTKGLRPLEKLQATDRLLRGVEEASDEGGGRGGTAELYSRVGWGPP